MLHRGRTLAVRLARRPPAAGALAVLGSSRVRALSTTAGAAPAEASATSTPATPSSSIVGELERLQQKPWWQVTLLRLGGVFSDEQWQAAAGSDMYVNVVNQAKAHQDVLQRQGAVPDRYYAQLQTRGLLCWLTHVRLRDEPKERFAVLYKEMMEKVWQQAELDLTREFEMGYVQMAKHIKAAQLSWHGLCKHLDEALLDPSPRDAMSQVLLRNVYVDEEGEALVDDAGEPTAEAVAGSRWLADYLLAQRAHLHTLSTEDVLKGRLTWASPPAPPSS